MSRHKSCVMSISGDFVKINKSRMSEMLSELSSPEFKLLTGLYSCTWATDRNITITRKGKTLKDVKLKSGYTEWCLKEAAQLFGLPASRIGKYFDSLIKKGFIRYFRTQIDGVDFEVVEILEVRDIVLKRERIEEQESIRSQKRTNENDIVLKRERIESDIVLKRERNNPISFSKENESSTYQYAEQQVAEPQECSKNIATLRILEQKKEQEQKAASSKSDKQEKSEIYIKRHNLRLLDDPLVESYLLSGKQEEGVFIPREPEDRERGATEIMYMLPCSFLDSRLFYRKGTGNTFSQDLTRYRFPLSQILEQGNLKSVSGIQGNYVDKLLQDYSNIVFYPHRSVIDERSQSQSIVPQQKTRTPLKSSQARILPLLEKDLFGDPPRIEYAAQTGGIL